MIFVKQNDMKWISIKDRLPEEGIKVLTLDYSNKEYKEYRIDYVVKLENTPETYIWACRISDDYNKVTHWMPLPEPPKE